MKEIDRVTVRLRCAEMCLKTASTLGMTKLKALEVAEKVYDFVIKAPAETETEQSAPADSSRDRQS